MGNQNAEMQLRCPAQLALHIALHFGAPAAGTMLLLCRKAMCAGPVSAVPGFIYQHSAGDIAEFPVPCDLWPAAQYGLVA